MRRVAACCLSLLTGALVLFAAGASAEIVAPTQPDSGQKAKKSAAEVRSKAKAYQESTSGSPAIVVVPEEEEESLLGPRRQPESGASQNRSKASQYRQGSVQGTVTNAPDSGSGAGANTSEKAQESRLKARSYVSTDNTVVIERIGSDGIPIVSCGKLIANVAGRIGDDMQPGGTFFIMRDNKPFKVRCAQQ